MPRTAPIQLIRGGFVPICPDCRVTMPQQGYYVGLNLVRKCPVCLRIVHQQDKR